MGHPAWPAGVSAFGENNLGVPGGSPHGVVRFLKGVLGLFCCFAVLETEPSSSAH
jgi:hypothetical protein